MESAHASRNRRRHPAYRIEPGGDLQLLQFFSSLFIFHMSRISILVFVASPLDYARYRHAALYIQYDDAEIKSSVAEVVGTTGFYSYSERVNWEIPVLSTSKHQTHPWIEVRAQLTETDLARTVPVSTISESIPASALREIISQTPIPNTEMDDWNSQDWVSDALGRLVEIGCLDESARDTALDGMVNAVLEAGDEEV